MTMTMIMTMIMMKMIRLARKSLVSAIPGSKFHFRNGVDWEQEPDDDDDDLVDVDHEHEKDIDVVKNDVEGSSGAVMNLRPRVRSGKATAEKTWKYFFVTYVKSFLTSISLSSKA